jgi:hypothetical protein
VIGEKVIGDWGVWEVWEVWEERGDKEEYLFLNSCTDVAVQRLYDS